MAYLPIRDDEEERLQAAGAQQRQPRPVAGGVSAPAGPAAQASPSASAYPGGNTSNDFIGFERYLAANKDSAEKMAGGLASDLDRDAAAAQKGLVGMQGRFGDDVSRGTLTYHPETSIGSGKPKPNASSWGAQTTPTNLPVATATPQGRQQQGLSRPQSVVPTTASITAEEAKARAGRGYEGPGKLEELDGYGDLAKQTTEANKRLILAGRPTADERFKHGLASGTGGLQALLDERNGVTSQGASRLNAALAGAAGGDRFSQLRSKYGDLSAALTGANVASAKQADAAKVASAGAAKKYQSLLDEDAALGREKEKVAAEQRQAATEAGAKSGKAAYDRWVEEQRGLDQRGVEHGSDMARSILRKLGAGGIADWDGANPVYTPPLTYAEWAAHNDPLEAKLRAILGDAYGK